jgi:UrcA family protein
MRTPIALSLLAVCGLGAASLAASAATPIPESDAPSITVRYGDLDLSTDKGTRVLYRRLSGAANLVCPRVDNRDLTQATLAAQCRSDAIAKAVKKVNNAHLAEIASSRTHAG